jgi:flagellar motility protein MotE (MotC chaperone)
MDYQTLEALRRMHPAWRLLTAAHAPLIASFLQDAFIRPNVRTHLQSELISKLDDHLYKLRAEVGDEAFPKTASAYLDDWASDEHGWLRKYYFGTIDEPSFDITPATEKALEWLAGLQARQFVGTESRMMTVFDLLRQLVERAQTDPGVRIAELQKRRGEIDREIHDIQQGQMEVLDATQIRERFMQIASTARGLLSDFREVEQNFRSLDREVRERIATWEGGKAGLLDEVFGQRDLIADSDQGKSFRAFWDLLMSPSRQEELSALLKSAFAMEAVQALEPDGRLLRIHYDWLEAGEVAQRTVARLSEQLRRYLDDQAWLENRRIMDLIRQIEQNALAVRDDPPGEALTPLDEPAPRIGLAMDRPLFTPPEKTRIQVDVVEDEVDLASLDALFATTHVDRGRLMQAIRRQLQSRSQVSLEALIEAQPLEQGLAELITYLSLAADDPDALIDEGRRVAISWVDDVGVGRRAVMPVVVFKRPVQTLEPAS